MSDFIVAKAESLDNPFWQFSLAVYSDSKVQKSCLQLQNDYDANVNLLLYCCWLAKAVEPLAQHELATACQLVAPWHRDITMALRKIRKLRQQFNCDLPWNKDFFKQILHDELLSECYQQHLLYELVKSRQTAIPVANGQQAYIYLCWLFVDEQRVIDSLLAEQLRDFVRLVYASA